MNRHHPIAIAASLALALLGQQAAAQSATPAAPAAGADTPALPTVTVGASADASAQGLSPAYPGGQVARGGRAGILGTRDGMETPFSITSYTNELIQDKQAKSVGDVLQNDAGVRVARGFGNFQESYFIRGFILGSDDTAYNGLYGLLPRQYIATELFERVEVLRGASTFVSGAAPAGGGIGGSVNLLPKRAPNEPLSRVTVGTGSGGRGEAAVDIGRRFGPDGGTGIRFNAAYQDGDTAVDHEKAQLGLVALGLDWRSRDVRLSGDIGWQEHKLKGSRPNVTLSGLSSVPAAPDASANFSQPWAYSNERDVFGTFRGEVDLSPDVTAWGAWGLRRGEEANSLANLTVTNAATGAGNTYRFDNTRKDRVDTGELGVRGKLRTGAVGHAWVASLSYFEAEKDNAYAMDWQNTLPSSLYQYTPRGLPAFSANTLYGGSLASPNLTGRTRFTSFALGDTLSFAQDTVQLTLGLRHQRMEVSDYAYGTSALLSQYDQSHNSPLAALVFKVAPQWSLYGNYAESLSQGETAPATANGTPVTNRGQQLSPYVAKQKEVGIKYDGGRLRGSLALFNITRPRAYVTAANVFSTAGQDRHRGVELDLQGEAARGLRVLGGVTWLDAKQRETGVAALNGNRVIGVPRLQANAGVEWDVPGVRGLALDTRLVYTGASYADAANTLRVPGWTRLDLGVRYATEWSGRLVTLRARVDNVADRNYWASAGGYPGAGYLVVGAPRTFTLSASVDF
ncbi:iron complex outermembrane receptor protein [Paracidovorax anthurii]|uniref:Iron complex outermembrane receptor protein n=1 Tax=Paracidovorax anthurii TaxID=78229 RepID=A0A328ZK16_9BURK|nr:TonB-dependent receptor [Paracidovorax anthurii]RAR86229.1 iron complex outermembrane receptor protein [Paracidovorax anthurii]